MTTALAPESGYARYKRTRPVKWWHEAIIDDMLLHPLDTHRQRAARLGYTPQAIMILINSDMFKAAYRARREDLRERLDDGITSKLLRNASLGLDIMYEKLEKKRDSISFKDLTEANNSILSKLGYGAPSGGAAAVQVNVNSATPVVGASDLAEARARLRALEERRAIDTPAPVIDATPLLIEPARSASDSASGSELKDPEAVEASSAARPGEPE